jgi:N-acetylmuramoyl-L-alanine amidase
VHRRAGVAVALSAFLAITAACSGPGSPSRGRGDSPDQTTTAATAPPVADTNPSAPGRLAGRRICLDPGHEAYWIIGTAARDRNGAIPVHATEQIPLLEHALNLRVAYRLAGLLEAEGADVCVTRKPDGPLQIEPYDYTGDGLVRPDGVSKVDVGERVQPRIDWANRFGAQILLSIHFNGSEDSSVSGTEVYYSDTSPRAAEAVRLGSAVMSSLLTELASVGYAGQNRGVAHDRYERDPLDVRAELKQHYAAIIRSHRVDPDNCPQCDGLLPLGNNPFSLHLGAYTAALVEVEYMTNPAVVEQLLLRAGVVDVVSRGLANGILAFYGAASRE